MRKTVFCLMSILLLSWQSTLAYDFTAVAPSGQTLYYDILREFDDNRNIIAYAELVSPADSSWVGFQKPIGNLVIPGSVTFNDTTYAVKGISLYAFAGCEGLTSVTISDGIEFVNSYAFYNCNGLTTVTIGPDVRRIAAPFVGCTNLDTLNFNALNCLSGECGWLGEGNNFRVLNIGEKLKIIPGELFKDCTGITSVTIPDSIEVIGNRAFQGCTGMIALTIGKGVQYIATEAFRDCIRLKTINYNAIPECWFDYWSAETAIFRGCDSISTVNIGEGVQVIPYQAFSNLNCLTTVNISSTVSRIDGAFKNCRGLTSITIPDGVVSIVASFEGCTGLSHVTIGSGMDNIGTRTFSGCNHLIEFVSRATYPPICSVDAFENIPGYCKLIVPCGSLTYYDLQEPWKTRFTLKDEDCSGIDDDSNNFYDIRICDGMIIVDGAEQDSIKVFDVVGRPVINQSLHKGVYFVNLNDILIKKVVVIR